jgi:outer membrane protein TolC
MFNVSVPLYSKSKQRMAIEQRRSELSQRAFALSDTLRSIQTSISSSRAGYEAAREQVLLLETAIIPQARQTVASMLAGYQVNEVDFLNVVNSQITLYNSQINYWESLSTAKAALARLAAAAGMEALYE